MELRPKDYLKDVAFATALDVAAREDPPGEPVERRALPVREPDLEWSSIHLRHIFEQPVAVYDLLGEIEVVIDRQGKVWSLDDPRHRPTGAAIHRSEAEAVDAVLRVMNAGPKDVDLEAALVRGRDGTASLKVKNREARRPAFESKFFQRRDEPEEPEGPPPDRIDADVNAATGHVYRFRREAPPPPAEGAGAAAGGAKA